MLPVQLKRSNVQLVNITHMKVRLLVLHVLLASIVMLQLLRNQQVFVQLAIIVLKVQLLQLKRNVLQATITLS